MSYKILLVDDEVIDLEWLNRRVGWAELGFEVVGMANSGFSALKTLKEQHVDVLISDIRMPIMSGLELAKQAKDILPKIKVAFISGHEDFSYARQAITLSAVGYVLKPVDNDELLELLRNIKNALDKESDTDKSSSIAEDAINLGKERKLIEGIKKHVIDNIEEKITLKETADYFSFSPNYLGQVFKEATGESFSDFLVRARMERACEYLMDYRMKIYEICDRIGYKNILYFNRQFKDFYGITPTDYRKINKV